MPVSQAQVIQPPQDQTMQLIAQLGQALQARAALKLQTRQLDLMELDQKRDAVLAQFTPGFKDYDGSVKLWGADNPEKGLLYYTLLADGDAKQGQALFDAEMARPATDKEQFTAARLAHARGTVMRQEGEGPTLPVNYEPSRGNLEYSRMATGANLQPGGQPGIRPPDIAGTSNVNPFLPAPASPLGGGGATPVVTSWDHAGEGMNLPGLDRATVNVGQPPANTGLVSKPPSLGKEFNAGELTKTARQVSGAGSVLAELLSRRSQPPRMSPTAVSQPSSEQEEPFPPIPMDLRFTKPPQERVVPRSEVYSKPEDVAKVIEASATGRADREAAATTGGEVAPQLAQPAPTAIQTEAEKEFLRLKEQAAGDLEKIRAIAEGNPERPPASKLEAKIASDYNTELRKTVYRIRGDLTPEQKALFKRQGVDPNVLAGLMTEIAQTPVAEMDAWRQATLPEAVITSDRARVVQAREDQKLVTSIEQILMNHNIQLAQLDNATTNTKLAAYGLALEAWFRQVDQYLSGLSKDDPMAWLAEQYSKDVASVVNADTAGVTKYGEGWGEMRKNNPSLLSTEARISMIGQALGLSSPQEIQVMLKAARSGILGDGANGGLFGGGVGSAIFTFLVGKKEVPTMQTVDVFGGGGGSAREQEQVNEKVKSITDKYGG